MRNLKIHLIYWFILIITSVAIYASQNWQKYCFPKTEGGIELTTDIELIDPRNGEIVGYFKKGLYLSYPDLEDLHGCNVDGHSSSGHDRFKLLVNLKTSLLAESKNIDDDSIRNNIIILQERNKASGDI